MRNGLLNIYRVCLLLLLSQAALADKDYTLVPWHKLKVSAAPIELHSRALEIQDYANAGDTLHIYYALHAAHFNSRQEQQLRGRLLKPDNSDFNDVELSDIAQRLYSTIEERFENFFSPQQTWKFVHYRNFKKRHFLLYRIDNNDGAYDYVDLEFTLQNNRWQLIDWYTRSTDTWMSAVFSRGFQLVYNAQQQPNEASRALLAYLNQRDGNLIARFDALSPVHQRDPIVQASLMGFISKQSPEDLPAAFQRLQRLTEPNQFVVFRLNHAYEAGNLTQALQYCERLQQHIGGDSDLALLQAEILYQQNKTAAADQLVAEVIRNNPDSQRVFYMLLILFAYYDKYPQALLTLDILENDFAITLNREDIANIDGMEAFADSQELALWLSER